MRKWIGVTFCLSVAAAAHGQSVNVDINRTSGTGAGAPQNSFAAAGGQSGFWNMVNITSSPVTTALAGLNGQSAGLTVTAESSNGGGSGSFGGTDNYSKLMGDYGFAVFENGEVYADVNGLDEGIYRVIVYSALPPAAATYEENGSTFDHYNRVSVSVGNILIGYGSTHGVTDTPGTFELGTTHTVFTVPVGPGAPVLHIRVDCDFISSARAAFNGFQLVKIQNGRLYVDRNATGAGTGADWNNAITDLQDALQAARDADGAITEIWVADGTYTPAPFFTSDRTRSFELVSNVKIYGGFVGGETSLEQRDWVANDTVLHGNINITLPPGEDWGNVYHVVTLPDGTVNTLLDGFRVTSGSATGTGDGSTGGGIKMGIAFNAVFRNCQIVGNEAGLGGGAGVSSNLGSPVFADCLFYGNHTVGAGGAVKHVGSVGGFLPPWPRFVNCQFQANTAGVYGGALYFLKGQAHLANCVFDDNGATGFGGAIYVNGNGEEGTSIDIFNCTIAQNSSNSRGGGLYAAAYGQMQVKNSILWGNTAVDDVGCGPLCEQGYYNEFGTLLAYNFTIIEGHNGTVGGLGNNGADPLFIDADGPDNIIGTLDDDLRVGSGSPAVDSGGNGFTAQDYADLDLDGIVNESLPLDIDGQARFADDPATTDTGLGFGPLVDRGAYEFNPVCSYPGDIDEDGDVDLSDLATLLSNFGAAGGVELSDGDVDGDDDVDLTDLAMLLSNFGAACP